MRSSVYASANQAKKQGCEGKITFRNIHSTATNGKVHPKNYHRLKVPERSSGAGATPSISIDSRQ